MLKATKYFSFLLVSILFGILYITPLQAKDPLPSWQEGQTKQAIIDFVHKVINKNDKDYVPSSERIAVFDNDGTLWVEHPMYVQLAFAMDRVKTLAKENPQWKNQQPFKAVLENDMKTLASLGEKGVVELIMATHAGMTNEAFEAIVLDWLKTARHPKYKVAYTELVYQPMLELINYLQENEFKTFIVSGGGIEFMRPWSQKIYGIPKEQVIGSSIKLKYDDSHPKPQMIRLPEVNFIDDKEGKPIGIEMYIGKRPIAAFGNSDGDYQMLAWTTAGDGARLGMLVHHDDDKREYAYNKNTSFGKLDKAKEDAKRQGWHLINMKEDWKRIFSFE
ncbi:MAG: HAD family hydrolase [Candidatus Berkiella sp.]